MLSKEIANLQVLAPDNGIFIPDIRLRPGNYGAGGAPVGAFYPASGEAQLLAALPERMVETYQDRMPDTARWVQVDCRRLQPDALRMIETVSIDATSGARAFSLNIALQDAPAILFGRDVQIRLDFGARSILTDMRSHILMMCVGRWPGINRDEDVIVVFVIACCS